MLREPTLRVHKQIEIHTFLHPGNVQAVRMDSSSTVNLSVNQAKLFAQMLKETASILFNLPNV